ncbi:hypothetical protein STEG23_030884, partial [Scotinomys teguina]
SPAEAGALRFGQPWKSVLTPVLEIRSSSTLSSIFTGAGELQRSCMHAQQELNPLSSGRLFSKH